MLGADSAASCQHRFGVVRELSHCQRIAKRLFATRKSATRDRRLPSSKRAVSILRLWCTLPFMRVDDRSALKHGATEGNMAKKAKKAKAKKAKKTAKKK